MKLETKRLIIRPTEFKDVTKLYDLLSDEDTMQYFVEGIYSRGKVQEIVNRNKLETHHYSVLLKSSNRLIGKISFSSWIEPRTKEIGWIFFPTSTNNGYCTEAAKAVAQYAFEVEKLHRLIATSDPRNLASIRVCEKIGMVQEGIFKKCIHYKEDVWWDELFFSLLEEDYFKE
jgi:hypothetical protein